MRITVDDPRCLRWMMLCGHCSWDDGVYRHCAYSPVKTIGVVVAVTFVVAVAIAARPRRIMHESPSRINRWEINGKINSRLEWKWVAKMFTSPGERGRAMLPWQQSQHHLPHFLDFKQAYTKAGQLSTARRGEMVSKARIRYHVY